MSERNIPELNSVWQHKNGNVYVVYDVTNLHSQNDEYPVTISYYGKENGRKWSRALSRWYGSMTPLPSESPTCSATGNTQPAESAESDYAKRAREAARALAETAITSPYLFPAYGQWTGAKQALDIAAHELNEAETRWLKLLEPILEEPFLRELAERKGLLPKASDG